jgi:hypothetical protein
MSTSNPQPGATPRPAPVPTAVVAPPARRQIVIVSHSNLFYCWPVWAVGFLFGIVSLFGEHLATVPTGTKAMARVPVTIENKEESRHVLVYPKGAVEPTTPYMHVSSNKNVGVVFCAILLLVIAITNVPLRGLWSFIVILLVLFVTIILAILDKWSVVFEYLSYLDIRISAGGYLFISSILFVLWVLVVFLFDQQIYMVFEPGQLRVRQSIGDAEMSYDTTGMTTQKQRSDLFRHWILGLGSGDLIVKTAGAHPTEIDMNNVLFVGRKHREIEELLRSREVVSGNNN